MEKKLKITIIIISIILVAVIIFLAISYISKYGLVAKDKMIEIIEEYIVF